MRRFTNSNYIAEFSIYLSGIEFKNWEVYIKLLKLINNINWDDLVDSLFNLNNEDKAIPEYDIVINELKSMWYDDEIKPLTIEDINKISNSELREYLNSIIKLSPIELKNRLINIK